MNRKLGRTTISVSPLALVCAVVLVLGLDPGPAAAQEGAARDAPRLGLLYWVSLEGTLLRADVDGSNMEVLRSGLDGPDGLSLDPAHDRIYWTNMSRGPSGSIQRARLDGSPIAGDSKYLIPRGDIVTGKEIELDLEGGRMYWADRDAPRIQRANLDGTGLETVLSGFVNDQGEVVPVENVVGMALDFENGTFYSSDRYMGIVFRAGLEIPDGESPDARTDVDIIFQGERDHDRPIDIDIDPEQEKIYWTDRGSDAVRRANLDGSDMEVLVENWKVEMRDAIGMSLDLAARKMYWSDMTTGIIHRANLDGSEIETVVPPNDHRPLGVEHMVLEPEVGPTAGGQRVGILGSNFVSGRTRVSFGGTPATEVEVVDSNLLLATVPPGSEGRVDLTVTTPAGTATAEDVYAYGSNTSRQPPATTASDNRYRPRHRPRRSGGSELNTPRDFGAYASDLDPRPANHRPLSPLTFLQRSARVYPDHPSVIHGDRRFTWSETYARSRRLASALSQRGIGRGDTVSVIATNTPALYEAHFGVPMSGAVLNAINTRLDGRGIAVILDHAETKLLITDRELSPAVKDALDRCENRPEVVDVDDVGIDGEFLGETEYEALLEEGDPEFDWMMPEDEWNAISLNYTSGTTGNPKGVVYHHRGAFLNAMSNIVAWNMDHHPVYLWTLPMFHCNGWCFPWSLAAVAGTSVCMRKVSGEGIYRAIAEHDVTHFCGAAIVLGMVIDVPKEDRRPFDHTVRAMTGGAPPPAAILEKIEDRGFEITHVYGLTETYGPAVFCAWKEEWDTLDADERADIKARQGVPYHVTENLDVRDPETMEPVPADGETMGEVMFRGNNIMKGYLKNPETTGKAFREEWFHSGDLGVMHPDGYIQLKDRSKDIIISGGENISSIEVEDCIYKHPAVDAAAVVARPDDKWGETPCAFVSLKPGKNATEQEIVEFCRENLAHFKCPRSVVFGDLPKTSTGKIQKFKLRDRAEELGSLS